MRYDIHNRNANLKQYADRLEAEHPITTSPPTLIDEIIVAKQSESFLAMVKRTYGRFFKYS